MKNLIKKILNEDLEGFLDPKSGDWEWAKDSEITLPPKKDRRKYDTDTFFVEMLGFPSIENYKDWREDPWEYEPREGDPDLEYGEADDYIMREMLWVENDKWKLVSDDISEVDIWEGNYLTTNYVFQNKQDNNSYWALNFTQRYEDEEYDDKLVEVFPYAQKIVFR